MTSTNNIIANVTTAGRFVTARCRPFTGYPMTAHRCLVDSDDGAVSVWDSVAGHYTTCHRLSKCSQRRIAKLAA